MIAYLSAEFAVNDNMPTYAGGLGVLAGDILMEASDSNFPLVGISLFYRQGVFQQTISLDNQQETQHFELNPEELGVKEVYDSNGKPLVIEVPLASRIVYLKVLKKMANKTPLYLLDAATDLNNSLDQDLTNRLYEGEWTPHISQDILLGVGAVWLARSLNLPIKLWHINDDHAAFSILERIREQLVLGKTLAEAKEEIKRTTIFTTHTPVSGAESLFPTEIISPYLESLFNGCKVSLLDLLKLGGVGLNERKAFSLSVLALTLSGKINSVSKRHSQFSQKLWSFLFPAPAKDKNPIIPITNAVYPKRWVCKPMDQLYAKYLDPNWGDFSDKTELWQKVEEIPAADLWSARLQAKKLLIQAVFKLTGKSIEENSLILTFAKRFTSYKRPTLLISDLDRLTKILGNPQKPTYLLMSGKAHPKDSTGQNFIQQVIAASQNPILQNHLIFLPNYDLKLAKLLVSGSDLWINVPQPPMEASGTSGMKALFNGVLNLMVADGWWYECFNGQNGWLVGSSEPDIEKPLSDSQTAQIVYDLLGKEVQPLYFNQKEGLPLGWIEKIKNSLSSTAAFISTKRLLKDYDKKLYQPLLQKF